MNEPALGISVLIPTLNEAACIGELLSALSIHDLAEIIVSDGGSSDETVEIVRRFQHVKLVTSPRGRGNQINTAARSATQPILLILHADTRLPANAAQLIPETLAQTDVAAGCFRLSFDRVSPLLKLYAWFSGFETRFTTFGDQAFFVLKPTFDAVGGAPGWPLLEDVGLRDRLKTHGRFVKRPEHVITSARRFAREGICRQQLRNAAIMAGYTCGISPVRLAAYYTSGHKF